jgi:hypothetical protein
LIIENPTSPDLTPLYIKRLFPSVLARNGLSVENIRSLTSFSSQSDSTRDLVLATSPLSRWLELSRDPAFPWFLEIPPFISSVLEFDLPEEDLMFCGAILHAILCRPGATDSVCECLLSAPPFESILSTLLTDSLLRVELLKRLRLDPVLEVIGTLSLETTCPLDDYTLFELFYRSGVDPSASDRFLGGVVMLVFSLADSEASIERMLQIGGCLPLIRISEDGSFVVKGMALQSLSRIMENGSVRQRCQMVELDMVEFLVNIVDSGDFMLVKLALDEMLGIVEAELQNGRNEGHIARLVQAVEGLGEFGAEEPKFAKRMRRIEAALANLLNQANEVGRKTRR